MIRNITIHKPTHVFMGADSKPIAIGQRRGDRLYLNRYVSRDNQPNDIEKTHSIGSCTDHLTGYGSGVSDGETRRVESMQSAWRFMFGGDVELPTSCIKL